MGTLNTSSTSTSTDSLDAFASMLDSCLEQLTPFATQTEGIEKETGRVAMLSKLMLETPFPELPLPEPPMVEPPVVEPDRTSAKRRRRIRYTLLLGMRGRLYVTPDTVHQS